MSPRRSVPFLVLPLFVILTAACGGGGGSESETEETIERSALSLSFDSLCGVIEDGKLTNPAKQLEFVSVQVIGSDAVIIEHTEEQLAGQQTLVKLHGITSSGVHSLRILNGIDIMRNKLSEGAYFVSPGNNCEYTFSDGGLGVLGQLFSIDGENMNELMLAQGAAVPKTDSCAGDTLAQCYQTIGIESRTLSDIELEIQSVELTSRCGAVVDGELLPTVKEAQLATVTALSSELLEVTRLLGLERDNPFLVKLHGITSEGISETRTELGVDYINSEASGEVYLVLENSDCLASTSGGQSALAGQIFFPDGRSLSEELLERGYAAPTSDSCGGELLSSCYEIIQAEAPEEETFSSESESDSSSEASYESGVIRDFLWKPVSEASGNLVVLVNPLDVTVVVTGAISETLRNQGPSNGRGTTARSSHSGCSFGNNVTVEFFDNSGERIPIITGDQAITISNGCRRVEFKL